MDVRGILTASAATLLAASSTLAADAVIVPEPEPAEYVRVCDIYGASLFYYIPGTDICLHVGGYFRYEIGYGDLFGEIGDDGDQTWDKRARFQLRMDARTETELGTLRGYLEYNVQWDTLYDDVAVVDDSDGDGVLEPGEIFIAENFNAGLVQEIEHAYVELAGFRIGVTDSLFITLTDDAVALVEDDVIPFGPETTHQIGYTFDGGFDVGNGFMVSAALEEGSDDEDFGEIINDYMPHVVVGAGYKAGIVTLRAVGGYDSNEEEFSVKGRLDVEPIDGIELTAMAAWTDDDDDSGGNYYAQWGGDWGLWTGGSATLGDRARLNAQFSMNGFDDYAIVADVNLYLLPKKKTFVVTPGVGYFHEDETDDDFWGGYLRTQFEF